MRLSGVRFPEAAPSEISRIGALGIAVPGADSGSSILRVSIRSGNFAEASKVTVDHVSVEVGGHHGGGVSENAAMLSSRAERPDRTLLGEVVATGIR